MSGPLLLGAVVFGVLLPLVRPFIRWLEAHGLRKRVRADLPTTHMVKAGTPTMGGLLFVGATALVGIVLLALGNTIVLWPTVTMLAYAGLGTFDDLKEVRDLQGMGWLVRIKFSWQWVLALVLALGMYLTGAASPFWLPFGLPALDLGLWFVPVAAFLIVTWVNSVNLTDGLDGLAGGCSAIVVVALAVLASQHAEAALAYWSMALAGALLAYLWFNVRPASFFMGDIGAEGLGAALAAVALVSGQMVPLLVTGFAMLSEPISDLIQVGYFKYTKRRYGEGRRVFRRAPLHHHFEAQVTDEVQVTLRYWLATAGLALLAVAMAGAG